MQLTGYFGYLERISVRERAYDSHRSHYQAGYDFAKSVCMASVLRTGFGNARKYGGHWYSQIFGRDVSLHKRFKPQGLRIPIPTKWSDWLA